MADHALCIASGQAVRAHHTSVIEYLILRSALCTHGGLTAIEAALHSYPRLSPQIHVALVRHLLDLHLERTAQSGPGRALADARYRAAVGHVLLASACLPEGPELLTSLVWDRHVAHPLIAQEPSPEVEQPLQGRRRGPKKPAPASECETPLTVSGAVELSRRVLLACTHMNSPKYDGYAGQKDAKTLLCGNVRARLRHECRHAYEQAAAQLHLCHQGVACHRWSPAHHLSYPPSFQQTVRVLLLCARRMESPLSKLPVEALLVVVELFAHATYWEVDFSMC